jgi:hypothetical protein
MKTTQIDLLVYFENFINEMRSGRRLQPNGRRFTSGTIKNYESNKRTLELYSEKIGERLTIKVGSHLTKKELLKEQKYWKRFYRNYTNFLYKDRNCFDNYVGFNIKLIRAFFNYLKKHKLLNFGDFHLNFYPTFEEKPIIVLSPERLSFLTYNQEFENSLPTSLKNVKNLFVFGCTVALRYSDLTNMKHSNIKI